MIQIKDIHIKEFRGIRDLHISPEYKPFAICGPNGSGKSGVVDAIDFALTGSISRLSGSGSGGLTLRKHGPHVYFKNKPGSAQVALTVRDVESGKSALLTRNVATPKQYTLQPDIPQVRSAIEEMQLHPELTLSRREIIRYVLAEAGKRARQVQALLKLDRLQDVRDVLRTVETKAKNLRLKAQDAINLRYEELRQHLDIKVLTDQKILAAINEQRRLLDLAPLSTIDENTNLAQGVDTDLSDAAFNKTIALRDVSSLEETLTTPTALAEAASELSDALDILERDPTLLNAVQQHDLVAKGLDLTTGSHCPLCDLPWPTLEALRAHLAKKLARSEAAANTHENIREKTRKVASALQAVRVTIGLVSGLAALEGSASLGIGLREISDRLIAFEASIGSVAGALGERTRLSTDPLGVPQSVMDGLATLHATLETKPDQTASAVARKLLILAQDRWDALRVARSELDRATTAHKTAAYIYNAYCDAMDQVLTRLYKLVTANFSDCYRKINADDESAFVAQLEPSAGKLNLSVDFYSLGMYPPAAYHSEGHQDSMGLCLYLALMNQVFGESFRFAVLDDVVMSVDRGHRRRLCELLKKRFPDVQFIITTHDEVWASQMQSVGLITKKAQVKFHSWTVVDGPAYEEGVDLWDRIAVDLARDDVPCAAGRLRRTAESLLRELAENLRAEVSYRAAGDYDRGELLSAVNGSYNKWLGKAAVSANSWGNKEAVKRAKELDAARAKAMVAESTESWPINRAIHFNEWASFSREDFEPVVAAWKEYLALFACDNVACGSLIFVTGSRGREDALRCACGTLNLNLKARKK